MRTGAWIVIIAASLTVAPATESAAAGTLDEAAYNQALQRLYLDLTRDELIALAGQEYERIERAMHVLARQIDPSGTWQQILSTVEQRHRPASLADVIPAYRKETDRARAFVLAKDLVTLPDAAPLTIEPTPPELLQTFPYVIYQWRDALLVTLALGDDRAAVEEALRTHNDGLIAVAAVHEVYPGHRVQNLTRPGFQIAESFTEGWGLYVEELMFRLGYYDDRPPAIKLYALRMLLHRAARALLDPRIHRGDLSPEEAIRFLVERVGISQERAAMEVNGRYLTQPGSAATYLVGKRQIEQLRRQIEAREGARFDLKRFHDRLLSRGGVPVQDIARFAFDTELDREGVLRANSEDLINPGAGDGIWYAWIALAAGGLAALALVWRGRRLPLSFLLLAAMTASACGRSSAPAETAEPAPPAPQAPSTPSSRVAVSSSRDGAVTVEDLSQVPETNKPLQATMSPEEGRALAAEIRRAIEADPRIPQAIEVSYEPPTAFDSEGIRLSGTIATDDERDALLAVARKHTDLPIRTMVDIVTWPDEEELPGPWVEPASTAPRIPLCAGLTVVTAIASQGDYESIKTILSVTPDHVRMKYSSESSPPWWSPFRNEFKRVTTHRTILTRDLASAHTYAQYFTTTRHTTDVAPGTTAIGTSAEVLRELKTDGVTNFSYCEAGDDVVYLRDGKPVQTAAGCLGFTDPFPLKRVGTGPVAIDVLVDGTPVQLPAVLARGRTGSRQRVEFAFLNDESNPLTLSFRIGIGEIPALGPDTRRMCENEGRKEGIILTGGLSCDLPDGGDRDTLRVTKISTRCEVPTASAPAAPGAPPPPAGGSEGTLEAGGAGGGGAAALERALIEKGSVDVYSIYFSFNSDVIREESTPTLEDIAAILRRHPAWKLRLNGHTDSIGSDGFNLDLSRRRAAAVKATLVERYGIAAGRLDTAGFGESQPKDTNDTIEGRARNRRVELIRSGS